MKLKNKVSKKKKILFGFILIVLFLICYGVWYTAKGISKAKEILPYIEQDLNTYLAYISDKQYDKAYLMFSDEYKKVDTLEEFKEGIIYRRPDYAEYQIFSVDETDFSLNYSYSGGPTYFQYIGEISYTDRTKGNIESTFIKEDDKWKLYSVTVYAPLSRYKKFTPPQEKLTPTE